MNDARLPAFRSQALIGLAMFGAALWLAWEASGKILVGDLRALEFSALAIGGCGAVVVILRNWRTGFYLFFVWMLFEDLVRKYMGNGTLLFFGKDILLALVFASFYRDVRRGREKWFRAPFLLFLGLFIWLGAAEIFNQNSPSILYGLLGFKLYFYYILLMYVGYALIRSDEDLRKLLTLNALLAVLIGGVGIIQAIVGNSFLNPRHIDPALQELSSLDKVSPISNQIFNLPDSVFVSTGRFGQYLLIGLILAAGTVGYLLLHSRRGRKISYLAIGTIGMAILLSGSRGTLMLALGTLPALAAGFLWGAPWKWGEAHRLVKALWRACIAAALGLAAILIFFPEQAGSRIAFYAETLLPSSSSYELSYRTWDYPLQNFRGAFSEDHWLVGNGIGTGSLGTQYVSRLLKQPPPGVWVEEGYGDLVAEMGVLAPLLWLLWTAALLYYSWKVVRRLRATRFFPIALAIFWYAFLLLYPITYGGLFTYQSYTCNVYLWLLVGILFRLPELLGNAPAPEGVRAVRLRGRGGFRF